MTTTVVALFESKFAEAVDTAQYTSEEVVTVIDKITAINTSASLATIFVNLVPAEGTASAENQFSKVLQPGVEWTFPAIVGHVLRLGDIISTRASIADVVSIRASGRQFS